MNNIHTDQLGYLPNRVKKAVVLSDDLKFTVCRAENGEAVYSGMLSEPKRSEASDENVRSADFSEVTQAGKYYIKAGGSRSYPFIIDEKPYSDLSAAVLEMFNRQKCGVAVDCGVWSHPACHTSLAAVYGTDKKKDVSGGWHDAGDYGRYIVAAAVAAADLLLAYEMSPEPDLNVLDTVWFELEWMLKMQDEVTGGVYHKVTCKDFCGFDVMPEDETEELILSPISGTATADFAAVTAMASRFYPEKCDILLKAAKRAWEWCEANPDAPGFKNPEGVTTGEYGDFNSRDEYFWAACELFAAAKEDKYHDYIKSSEVYSGLGWGNVGAFGLAAYLFRTGKHADGEVYARMENTLNAACLDIIDRYKDDPYGVSLGVIYRWGSSMVIANNAMMLLLGNRLNKNDGYIEAAYEHIHYLLGRNPLSQCYITGFGPTAPQNPHHRPSAAKKLAMPGMVVGGPDMTLCDEALKKLCKDKPPAKCYLDDRDSFASNEIAIYWNSPVYFVLSVLGL